jgi:hypothetical protein
MNRIVTRPSPGSATLLDASNEGVRHIQRTTLALMRGQHALKQLEAKTIEAEEASARVKSSPSTVADRKRRAAEIVGSFEGDFVTSFGDFAGAVVREAHGRQDGKPAYASPIVPYSGSSTRSPFVCVAAR